MKARRVRKRRSGIAWVVFVLLTLVAVLAPFLANDRPVVASVKGALHFPVLRSVFGMAERAPQSGRTWKSWWSELRQESDDWAWMPLLPYGPHEVDMARINAPPNPGLGNYMGNDDTGRDLLVRLLHGASTALWIAFGTALIALLIGVPMGAWAGLRGGWADILVTRCIEVFLCFPAFFFVLAVLAFVPSSTLGIVLVLGLLSWTAVARIVRGELLSLRERGFVETARGLGVGGVALFWRHLLPQIRGQILVTAAFVAAMAIVVESSLRFLGVGGGLDVVSWGLILQQGREHAYAGAWHLWLFPSLAIVATVSCLHALADRWR